MAKNLKTAIVRLLLWSQKYTKADMLYIARGGFWSLLNQGITSVLSLGLVIAFANLLPKETYGAYTYILSIAGILNIFTLTGMNAAVSRTVARGTTGILKPVVLYQMRWNLIMVFAFFAIAFYYYGRGDSILGTSFLILGFFIPVTMALSAYGAFLDGKKEFARISILRTGSAIVYASGMFLAIYLAPGVPWLIGTYAFTTFLGTAISYFYTTRRFKEEPTTQASETLSYGRELTYIQYIDPILAQIDKIVLWHFWGPAQLATYTLASIIPSKATLLIKSLMNIGFPKFATKTPALINTVFYRRILQGMIIGGFCTLAYILLSPYLFTFVLPQYIDGLYYSQLLSLTFIFALPNRYMSLLFSSQRLSGLILKRTVILGIMNTLLYLIFGIQGGIYGLVLASLIVVSVGLLINIVMWQQFSKSATTVNE